MLWLGLLMRMRLLLSPMLLVFLQGRHELVVTPQLRHELFVLEHQGDPLVLQELQVCP